MKIIIAASTAIFLSSTASANPAPAERTFVASARVEASCPVSVDPSPALLSGERETHSAGLMAVVAPFLGDLVGEGVRQLAGAIETASAQRDFVTRGVAETRFYNLGIGDHPTRVRAELALEQMCLILSAPSEAAGSVYSRNDRLMAPASGPFDGAPMAYVGGIRDDVRVSTIAAPGTGALPALYIEAVVANRDGALVIIPRFVWYRERMRGAPDEAAATELQVTMATPNYDAQGQQLGTPFNTVRIPLPRMAPGTILGPDMLQQYQSIGIPTRPLAGTVQTAMDRINTAQAQLDTANVALVSARRARDAADRAHRAQPNHANRELQIAAGLAAEDAAVAASAAQSRVVAIRAQYANSVPAIGATNVSMRFVVTRNANRLGLAIAQALGANRENIDQNVTAALTPTAQWSAAQTTYLNAIIAVEAAERELAAATAAANAADIQRTSDALRLAKARANEAAVAVHRDIPYPGLLPA